MLMVQKFHSIHEIDPEFIPSLELLLQEEIPSFDVLVQRHDTSPETDLFTYFLFFGPTQNTPIGFAQLCLKKIPADHLRSWAQKIMFWNKEHEHWKQLTWQIGKGGSGISLFDPKYSRSGKEKMKEILKEYELRSDVMAVELFSPETQKEFRPALTSSAPSVKEFYILGPLIKNSKTYHDYLEGLDRETSKHVKSSWKELNLREDIKLGDYPNSSEITHRLPLPPAQLKLWEEWGSQVLTFEVKEKILGCLLVRKGKNGNVFFEPFPFEPEGNSLVGDELYIQYAILKFYEMPDARRCHLMKFGFKISFEAQNDLRFFQEQGFETQTLLRQYQSKLPGLTEPL
jgi:hypothetical protein